VEFIEIAVQTTLAFFGTFFYARILGKQQISQLTFYEYINGITFGSIAGNLATDIDQRTMAHFIGLTLFFVFTLAFSFVSLKSRPLRKIIEGEPVVLIHNGKVLENNMKKMRYNLDALDQQLREKDVFDIGDVEFAVSETDGELSVLLKSDKQAATPSDLNISTKYQGISSEIITDGNINYKNLEQNNLSLEWLQNQLQRQRIKSPKEITYAVLNTQGDLYVDRVEDDLKNEIDISDY